MNPAEKIGLWCLRWLCFIAIFFGCLLSESENESLWYERFTLNFGYIPANRWDDLVVAMCAVISVLITSMIVRLVSGKSEAVHWLAQICVFFIFFTGLFTALPERFVSFITIAGAALILTSLLIFVVAKRKGRPDEEED